MTDVEVPESLQSPGDLPLDTPDSPLDTKQLKWVATANEPAHGSPMFRELVNPTFDPVAAAQETAEETAEEVAQETANEAAEAE